MVLLVLRGVCVSWLLGVGQAHNQEPPEREVSDKKRMMSFTCRMRQAKQWRQKRQQQQQQSRRQQNYGDDGQGYSRLVTIVPLKQ